MSNDFTATIRQDSERAAGWFMDSDFCDNCGCFLIYGESGLCEDCMEELLREYDDEEYWMPPDDDTND